MAIHSPPVQRRLPGAYCLRRVWRRALVNMFFINRFPGPGGQDRSIFGRYLALPTPSDLAEPQGQPPH